MIQFRHDSSGLCLKTMKAFMNSSMVVTTSMDWVVISVNYIRTARLGRKVLLREDKSELRCFSGAQAYTRGLVRVDRFFMDWLKMRWDGDGIVESELDWNLGREEIFNLGLCLGELKTSFLDWALLLNLLLFMVKNKLL